MPIVQRRSSRRGRFRSGHGLSPVREAVSDNISTEPVTHEYHRLERNIQEMVDSVNFASGSHDAPEVDDATSRMKREAKKSMLEKAQEAASENAEMDTYRLFHAQKLCDLFNEAIAGHRGMNPHCTGVFSFYLAGEMQRGVCWREQLACSECDYISPRRNIYKEVESTKRGPKTATANLGIQVGCAHTGISNTGLGRILLAANTPAPAKNSMQKTANQTSKVIEQANEKDMDNIIKELKEVQQARGHKMDAPIDIAMDARYNNPVHSGVGVTPYQAASQVTHLVTESITKHGKIIRKTDRSKLCQVCAIHSGKSESAPPPHECTASLKVSDPIGDERALARESLLSLNDRGVTANIVTTDPDASAFRGAEDLFLEGKLRSPPKHNIDTRHMLSNQRKKTKGMTFSKTMFHGCATQRQRQRATVRFGNDLSTRCHAEHSAAVRAFEGDAGKVSGVMPKVRQAMMKCYSADHSLCAKDSYVCRGTATRNWLVRSSFLANNFKIDKRTDEDYEKLNDCINYRLSSEALQKTRYLLNTQKCEETNRAISATAPKNITFSRNYSGRSSAAVHGVNAGHSEAIITACHEAGASLTSGTRVTTKLLKLQLNDNRIKELKKSKKYINKRYLKRKSLHEKHASNPTEPQYKKNVTLPLNSCEHDYCKK